MSIIQSVTVPKILSPDSLQKFSGRYTKIMAKKLKKKTAKAPLPEKTGEGEIKKTKIRVIGIGGGGGNIVSEIASRISKASFVAANTDAKSLKGCSRKAMKFQFGQNLTHGLGTGMNPELGKMAAQNEKEKIKKLLEGYDLCILVASLGGGTGSGAVSTFAKISKNLGNLTYGIFTLPFKFEGGKKMEIALNGLKEARAHFNAITVIPNERVFQVVNKDTPLKEALSAVNKFLAESLGGLIETIYEPGLINIDFADFKTILEGRGRLAYLNTIESQQKEGAIKDVAETAFRSPFYPYTIRGAKGVLFNIVGEKNLSLSDVNQISKAIAELANPEAKIIFGIAQYKKYPHVIKTILLATGCGSGGEIKISSGKKKKTKKPTVVKKEEVKTPDIKKPKTKITRKKKKNNNRASRQKGEGRKENKVLFKQEKQREQKKIKVEEVPAAEGNIGNGEKIRKNALQIKKEAEEMEKEMVEKEKFWETPAFLRKKLEKG